MLASSEVWCLKTPPRLSLSEWAAEYAYVPMEGNASPGKFEAYGYQNGLMDAVTDPTVKLITVMKSARIGYTRLRVRRDPVLLRTFVNLVLGETWEEATEKIEGNSLLRRAENYGA
jgi:phage terminase large subunit GpA-like protein